MNETNIMQLVRLKASQMGAIIWRNNTGKLQDRYGRWVAYGLCVGSSDLIGLYNGRFLALEVKIAGKKPTKEQATFIKIVNDAGGIAAVVTHPDQLTELLK